MATKKCSTRKASRETGSKTASRASTKCKSQMRITSRIVDVRRHTKGYMAGGKNYTVSQIRNLAARGSVRGVQVVGRHIQARPGSPRLHDLPTKIMKKWN